MLIKRIIMLMVILTFLLSLSAVCASDNMTNDAVGLNDEDFQLESEICNDDVLGNASQSAVVTKETFNDFFDEGVLLDSTDYGELIFKGEFDKTADKIIINRPISITGQNALLKDMAILVNSSDVKISNLELNSTNLNESLITVAKGNVNISDLMISHRVNGSSAVTIDVLNACDVRIENNVISFESSNISDSVHANVIRFENVTNSLIKGNAINDKIDYSINMSTLNTGNGECVSLKINYCENITLSDNNVETKANNLSESLSEIGSLYVLNSKHVLIDSNNFTCIDNRPKKGFSVIMEVVLFNGTDICVEGNNLHVSNLGNQSNSYVSSVLLASDVQFDLIGNNISALANEYVEGLIASNSNNYSSEVYVADNRINITCYPGSLPLGVGINIDEGNAKIYGNEIYVYRNAEKDDANESSYYCGIRRSPEGSGNVFLDVQDNIVQVQGDWTIAVKNGTNVNIVYNTLRCENSSGDDSVLEGYVGTVENNSGLLIPKINVECQNVWIGRNANLTARIADVQGNITITVGNKTFYELPLVNGIATQIIDASDLANGANRIAVTFNGNSNFTSRTLALDIYVLDGRITNETFHLYFDRNNGNMLFDYVPENMALDFRGSFIGANYTVYINKPENIVSTTGDAVFDSGENPNKNWVKFNIVENADCTNLTGIRFINVVILVTGASHVTLDDIYLLANMSGVGSGTGIICFRSGGVYGAVKNSYIENAGAVSSLVVAGNGASFLTVDRNEIHITGSSANIISSNTRISEAEGDPSSGMTVTNNRIYNICPASSLCYAISLIGPNNLVENNTIFHNGTGIVNAYWSTSENNVYRNNTLIGSATFKVEKGSLAENNDIEGSMTVYDNSTVKNNVIGRLTISGPNSNVTENNIKNGVTFSPYAVNTRFINNTVGGTLIVNSDGNVIMYNFINSSSQYAIDIKSSNNVILGNVLYANGVMGNEAINISSANSNEVNDNLPAGTITDFEVYLSDNHLQLGDNQTVNVVIPANVTCEIKFTLFKDKKLISTVKSSLANGNAVQTFSNLDLGVYEVIVQNDDLSYDMPSRNVTFTVGPKVEITQNVTVGSDATINADFGNVTDVIIVKIDGKSFAIADIENGSLNHTFSTSKLAAGDHIITFAYEGDQFDENALGYPDTQTGSYIPVEYGLNLLSKEVPVPEKIEINEDDVVILEFPENATGTVEIFVNGQSAFIVEIVGGIAKIDLSKYKDGNYNITFQYSGDEVYASFTKDIQLKAATITANSVTVQYGTGKKFTATVCDGEGKSAVGVSVVFKIKGKQVGKAKTNSNGIASYTINEAPGKHPIVVSALGVSVTKTITVKHLVSLKTVAVKKSAKKLVLTATLAKINKKYLKGKKITFKFNGKKYTAKTDKKGTAKVTVKSSVLKKLKVGKKVTYQATFMKDTVKKTVKIRK